MTAAALRHVAEWLADMARALAEHEQQTNGAELNAAQTDSAWGETLTRRECQVAAGIARGLTNRQIAAELVIATSTTERHVANILGKLGMRSRAEIAAWAAKRGFGGRAA